MTIYDLETPALLIDAAILDSNLQRMAAYCAVHDIRLRPHTKTHKIPQIAHMQIRYGAPGITVAKVSEAEVMVDAGITDILIVYPVWGEKKWNRLAELSRRAQIAVAVDSLAVASGISATASRMGVQIGIRAEFDTGFHRCGLPIEPSSIETVRRMISLPGIRWEGISLYPGQIMGDHLEEEIARENSTLDQLFQLLADAGIPHPIVSGGNTPAAYHSHRFHFVNEIRPGTYVFNDRNTVDGYAAQYKDCALSVLTTVVSASVAHRRILDAGSKTLSADHLLTGSQQNFGFVLDHPEVALVELSEEHGHLFVSGESSLDVGDRVRVIPNHVCPCVNLHDRVYLISGENVLEQWQVAARGRVC